jgi:diacylglycerol kinase (ATP)
MRIALLVNASSGQGTDADAIEAELRSAGAEVVSLPAERTQDVARHDPERVVIASGDGNVASAAEAAGAIGVPLAVVPSGTANDFARRMRLPSETADACRLAVRGKRVRRLDLALLGDRPFVNVAAAGLSPAATDRAGPLKPVLGPAAYLASALRAALTERPIRCAVRCDGRELFAGEAWQVMIGCSGAFGAGSRLDEADPADGLLDAVAIAAGPRLRLARHAYGLRRGRVSSQPGVAHARGRVVELELPAGERLNVDGDVVESALRAEVDPGRFELVVG